MPAKHYLLSIFKCEYLAEFINSGSEVFQNIDKIAKIDSWRMPKRGEAVLCRIGYSTTEGLDGTNYNEWRWGSIVCV